jgi:hypothetical protein
VGDARNDTSGPGGFTGLRWYARKENRHEEHRQSNYCDPADRNQRGGRGGHGRHGRRVRARLEPQSRRVCARVDTYKATLRYLVGNNVSVPADSAGQNATRCPSGMYPVGGGPSSPSTLWTLQFSNADAAVAGNRPTEWHVSLFNNSSSAQVFKVFVVCSTAQKVSSSY